MITAVMLLQLGNGLLTALLPLRMQADGLSATAIGLVAGAYGFGFIGGCLAVPGIVRRLGHRRSFAMLAAVVGPVAVAFTLAHDSVVAWVALRTLSGLAMAGLFTMSDSWISGQSPPASRGTVFAVYMVGTRVVLMLAPLGMAFGEVTGSRLFCLIGILMTVSVLPLRLFRAATPPPLPAVIRLRPLELYALAPSALVGSFVVGILNGSMLSLAPLYGIRVGLAPEHAALLILALQGGSLLTQWPLGRLSDRVDRRLVLAGVMVACALLSLATAGLGSSPPPALVFVAFAAWGAVSLSAYALCVGHGNDVVRPERLLATVGELLLAWAAGAMVGPVPAALALDRFGAAGLFLTFAAVSGALALFIGWRIGQRRRLPRAAGPAAALAEAGPVRLIADPGSSGR